MSKLYVRGPATLLDLLTVIHIADPGDIEHAHMLGFTGNSEALAIHLHGLNGPSWTCAHGADHSVVAVGGFARQRRGVYQSWFIAKQGAFGYYGRELTTICARAIENILKDDAHRVETVSSLAREKAHLWYQTIGLKLEAIHPRYGAHGEDAVTFVRVNECA